MNVCFESNIIDVPSDTWLLDSGDTIHACNSMQAVISRKSSTSFVRPEKFQFMEKWQNRNFDYKIVITVKNP